MIVLNQRLNYYLLAGITFSFMLVSLVNYHIASDSVQDRIEQTSLPLTSDSLYSQINQELNLPIRISSVVSNDIFLQSWLKSDVHDTQLIQRFIRRLNREYNVFLSILDDNTLGYYNQHGLASTFSKNNPEHEWYFKFRESNLDLQIAIGPDVNDNGMLTAFVDNKIYEDNGNYLGLVGIGVRMEAIENRIRSIEQKYRVDVLMLDRYGNRLFSGDNLSHINSINELDYITDNQSMEILTLPSHTLRYESFNKRWFLYSRILDEYDWILLVIKEQGESDNQFLRNMSFSLIFSFTASIIIGFIILKTMIYSHKKLKIEAMTDSLTGLLNRKAFSYAYEYNLKTTVTSSNNKSCLLILDIDHFKNVNDQYGHPVGDDMLVLCSSIIKNELRETDICARWGGEEFIALLQNCSILQGKQIAESIRKKIENMSYTTESGNDISITISIGIIEIRADTKEKAAVKSADVALYKAKQEGRNRVVTGKLN